MAVVSFRKKTANIWSALRSPERYCHSGHHALERARPSQPWQGHHLWYHVFSRRTRTFPFILPLDVLVPPHVTRCPPRLSLVVGHLNGIYVLSWKVPSSGVVLMFAARHARGLLEKSLRKDGVCSNSQYSPLCPLFKYLRVHIGRGPAQLQLRVPAMSGPYTPIPSPAMAILLKKRTP